MLLFSTVNNYCVLKDIESMKYKLIRYLFKERIDLRSCYTEQSKKSVLINANYQYKALNVLKELKNEKKQEELKNNPEKFLKDRCLTPNEVSFILFKLYHPSDRLINQTLIDSILKTSLLEFNKNDFLKFQENFNILNKDYNDLKKYKENLTDPKEIEEISQKIKAKKEALKHCPLMVLLDNLAFPVKNAKNCLNELIKALYQLRFVYEYDSLSPAGVAYFLLCLLRHRNPELQKSYCLSQGLDLTKVLVIADDRFILGDFTKSSTPFSDYKKDFESKFLN
ncbi:hypothetical protein [Alphaproteobacteria bacterium endosymbiont of Tiliacea citrago]|uniref:hypothetical protein n=1 Tax=Alphaproteobacteria bacterium endosymbiont of Tiliacea citrago TaxID=3077944 RepID=UPI00313CC4D1